MFTSANEIYQPCRNKRRISDLFIETTYYSRHIFDDALCLFIHELGPNNLIGVERIGVWRSDLHFSLSKTWSREEA
jgi:hypothetical protein